MTPARCAFVAEPWLSKSRLLAGFGERGTQALKTPLLDAIAAQSTVLGRHWGGIAEIWSNTPTAVGVGGFHSAFAGQFIDFPCGIKVWNVTVTVVNNFFPSVICNLVWRIRISSQRWQNPSTRLRSIGFRNQGHNPCRSLQLPQK